MTTQGDEPASARTETTTPADTSGAPETEPRETTSGGDAPVDTGAASPETPEGSASTVPGQRQPAPEAPETGGHGSQTPQPSGTASGTSNGGRLVPEDAVMDFQARWEAIQQGFVDDPRSAVTDADSLVGDVLQRLSSTFDDQHQELERQWTDGEPSTEDLRSALQRYRNFFDRLLAI